jgi:hypothetical protein
VFKVHPLSVRPTPSSLVKDFVGLLYRPRYLLVSNMPGGDTLKRDDEEVHYSAHAEDGADEVRTFFDGVWFFTPVG